MNAAPCAFLDNVARRWNEVVSSLSAGGVRSQAHRSSEFEKMVIEVESSTQAATIEAWEHAHCLDVTVLHLKSGVSTILSSGPCADASDLDSRLLSLCDVLLSNERN